MVDDSPVEFPAGRNGKAWKPENYDRKFRGPITYQQALEESVNVAAVKVQEKNGIRRTVDVARRLGVESPLGENLSLALGTSDLTLLEITSAYGALANQGNVDAAHRDPLRDSTRSGKLLEENTPAGQAGGLARAGLRDDLHAARHDRARDRRGGAARSGGPAAAKTGTTNDYSNAWFIGYTPQLATGVWVGYDRPRSLGKDETGSRVAVPIWTTFMQEALGGHAAEDFPIPERVVLVPVDLDRERCVRAAGADGLRRAAPSRRRPAARARYAPGVSPAPRPSRRASRRQRPRRRCPRRRSPGRAAPPPPRPPSRRPARDAAPVLAGRELPPRADRRAQPARRPSSSPKTVGELGAWHADLLHRVAVADRHPAVARSPFSASPTVCTSTVTQ